MRRWSLPFRRTQEIRTPFKLQTRLVAPKPFPRPVVSHRSMTLPLLMTMECRRVRTNSVFQIGCQESTAAFYQILSSCLPQYPCTDHHRSLVIFGIRIRTETRPLKCYQSDIHSCGSTSPLLSSLSYSLGAGGTHREATRIMCKPVK